jgi:hypothetical protein
MWKNALEVIPIRNLGPNVDVVGNLMAWPDSDWEVCSVLVITHQEPVGTPFGRATSVTENTWKQSVLAHSHSKLQCVQQ